MMDRFAAKLQGRRKYLKKLLPVSFLLFSISCQNKSSEVDQLGDAQICLDNLKSGATPAQVAQCKAKVEGLNSAGAEGIRCSAGFIQEGFADYNRFKSALDAVASASGASQVQSLMGLLSFTSSGVLSTDLNNTASTFNSCLNSQARGATLLASFSYLTMSLMNYFAVSGGCSSTPVTSGGFTYYNLSGCITSAVGAAPVAVANLVNPTTSDTNASSAQSSIGAVILATQGLSCTGTAANSTLCNLIANAVNSGGGASNPRGVAVQFFTGAIGLPQ